VSASEGPHTVPMPGPPVVARAQTSPPTDPDPEPGLSPERIAERVTAIDTLSELPLREHVELYQRLHLQLQSALAEIDGP
jgi:hypothetical protein